MKIYAKLSEKRLADDGLFDEAEMRETSRAVDKKLLVNNKLEAEAAVEAMATGHSTHFTMHAGVPIDAVNRLVTKYLMMMPSLGIDVVERIIGSAVDYIMIQDAIPGIGRRITSITEVDYDYTKQRVDLKTIVRFDVPTKSFVFENRLAKIKADKMLRKGIQPYELAKWAEGFDLVIGFSSQERFFQRPQDLIPMQTMLFLWRWQISFRTPGQGRWRYGFIPIRIGHAQRRLDILR